MAYAEWDSTLETGDETIDSQHRNLYAIVNELDQAVVEHRGKESVALVLVRLLLHAKTHFHDEEALMERINFPELARQRELHQQFEREAEMMSDEYLSGADVSAAELLDYLRGWLTEHVGEEDRQIVAFLNRDASRIGSESAGR